MPVFVKKRPFSRKHIALIPFFSNFHEKPHVVVPLFSQKNVD